MADVDLQTTAHRQAVRFTLPETFKALVGADARLVAYLRRTLFGLLDLADEQEAKLAAADAIRDELVATLMLAKPDYEHDASCGFFAYRTGGKGGPDACDCKTAKINAAIARALHAVAPKGDSDV